MLTLDSIKIIVADVKFRDWTIRIMAKADGFLLQVVFSAPDCESGCDTEQHGRKWYVSAHACRSEVVQTAYAAVQRAILHEVAEDFLYRGRRIYNPHLDVEELVELADSGKEDARRAPTFVEPMEPRRRPDDQYIEGFYSSFDESRDSDGSDVVVLSKPGPYYGNRFNR